MRYGTTNYRVEPGRGKRQGGNAIVELALILPILTSLLLGVWNYGYAFYNYAKLEEAVRAGARYASVALYDSASSTPSAAFQRAVQNVVLYGSPSPSGSPAPVVPSLSASNVVLTVTFTSVPTAMTVTINNYQLPAYFGGMTLKNKPSCWFAYTGTFGPP